MSVFESILNIFKKKETITDNISLFDSKYAIDITNQSKMNVIYKLWKKHNIIFEEKVQLGSNRVSIFRFAIFKNEKDTIDALNIINYVQNYYFPVQCKIDMDYNLFTDKEIETITYLGFSQQWCVMPYTLDTNFYYEIIPCNDKKYRIDKYVLIYETYYGITTHRFPKKGKLVETIYSNTNDDLTIFVLQTLRYLEKSEIGINKDTA